MTMLKFYRHLQPFSVISFDLDDTLYDNVPVMQASEKAVQAFIENQYPETQGWDQNHWRKRRWRLMQERADLRSNMTELRMATLLEGFHEAQVGDPQHAAETVMQQFLHHRSNFEVPVASHQLLDALKSRFVLVAVSNGNVDCEKIGIAKHFDVIVQPSEQWRGKPHPDMFEVVMDRLKVPAHEILHIGDHPQSDVLGAHRAGCQSGWFTGGLGGHQHLTVLPTFQFDDLGQLATLTDTGCTYSG